MFQIKICGITRPDDALDAVNGGADAIGLNFYKGSSRFIELEPAREITRALRSHDAASPEAALPRTKVIGVFVNATADYVLKHATECRLDAIQLHGDEDASFVWQVAKETGVPVIRAFALNVVGPETIFDFCQLPEAKEHLAAVLIDSAIPGQFGGTGVTADWDLVAALVKRLHSSTVSVILAGGLTPENVGNAVMLTGVSGVDVASGVESAPGVKDPAAMLQFVANARQQL